MTALSALTADYSSVLVRAVDEILGTHNIGKHLGGPSRATPGPPLASQLETSAQHDVVYVDRDAAGKST
jgi:hypothetical protein